MNFLSVLYAKAGITVDGITTLNNTATALTPTTSDNSTKIATTAFVKNQNYYPYPTGTTAQYVRGDGSLATFPTIAQAAQTLVTEVYNETGATLTKGTVVYINGGHGNLPTITKALASSDATSAQTYGVVQNDITDNNNGYVVVIGSVIDLNTNSYLPGTILYLSPTTAGEWTSTKPYAPQHIVYVAIVVRQHPTQGVVEVRVQNGYEMDELHNVSAQSPANGDILQFNFSTQLWTKTAGTTTNIAEGTNLYYTDARARAAISLTTSGTSGAATYSGGVLNIPQYQAALTNPVTGTGTTNYVTKWVSGSAVGNSIIYDNGTNVGIGTTTPQNAAGYTTLSINGSSGAQITWNSANTIVGAIYNSTGSFNIYSETGIPIIFQAGVSEKMRLASSGNLLIGTTSGSFPLTVVGKIGANIFGDSYLEFMSSGHTILKANNDVFVGYSQNFVVKQNGNVGIGNSNPSDKLDIYSNDNSQQGLKITNPSSGSSAITVTKYSNGTYTHLFGALGTGYAGYGVLQANEAFIYSSNQNLTFAADGVYSGIKFGTGAGVTERMRITSGGNVLIGTTTDAGYKLDVAGDIRTSNKVYVGTHGCYFQEVLIGGVYELQVVDSAGNMTVLS